MINDMINYNKKNCHKNQVVVLIIKYNKLGVLLYFFCKVYYLFTHSGILQYKVVQFKIPK